MIHRNTYFYHHCPLGRFSFIFARRDRHNARTDVHVQTYEQEEKKPAHTDGPRRKSKRQQFVNDNAIDNEYSHL